MIQSTTKTVEREGNSDHKWVGKGQQHEINAEKHCTAAPPCQKYFLFLLNSIEYLDARTN